MSATCTYVKASSTSGLRTKIKDKMDDGYRLVSVVFAEDEWVAWLAVDDSDIATEEANAGIGMLVENNAGLVTGSELTELHSTIQSLHSVVESRILPALEQLE